MSTPQAVTIRYVSSLLTNGRTNDFELDKVIAEPNIIDGRSIGVFFQARVVQPHTDFGAQFGVGATPLAAVRHALEKFGVTFR